MTTPQRPRQRAALVVVWIGTLALVPTSVAQTPTPPDSASDPTAWVVLESDPPGAEIQLGERVHVASTGVPVYAGRHQVEATLAGYQTLRGAFEVVAADTVLLRFVMLRNRPERPAPGDLDLAYQFKIPPLNLHEAEKIESTYWSLIETFAIIPLSQGLLLKATESDGSGAPGDEMILSGVGLIVGTYLLGDYLHGRKTRQIEERNEEILVLNHAVEAENSTIEAAIELRHAEDVAQWEREGPARGRLVVSRP